MKLHKLILFLFLLFLKNQGFAQHYQVTSFQDKYEEIEEFKSLMLELEGDLFWYHTFELNFTFPFFDLEYSYINGNYRGLFGFDDEIEYSMDLLSFGYQPDNLIDTSNIISDVRYKFAKEEGKNCLIVQYTRNRLVSDPSIVEFDTHVNFQYWFFEDGTIELRFGKVNLDNTPVYVPGDGFYLLTNEGPKPFGPFLGLTHPFNPEVIVHYNDLDSLQNFEIIDNWENGSVNWWPPEGWVIRFTNLLVSSNDTQKNNRITCYPNPTSGIVHVDTKENISKVEIYNINGNVLDVHYTTSIDMSGFPSGFYYIKVFTNQSLFNYKIFKN